MQELLITLKREYWENRAVIVGLPLIVATMALIAAIGVEIIQDKIADHSVSAFIQERVEANSPGELSKSELKELNEDLKELEMDLDDFSWNIGNDEPGNGIGDIYWFIGVSWLASFYYLLGALYNDRKDKSILFWKSLPISERFNVATKLGFGTVVVTTISIMIGWALTGVLFLFGLSGIGYFGLSPSSLYGYVVAPFEAVIIGLFWGAPVFAYLAWASAAAKRSPFLLVIVPIVVLAFLEGVVFENVEIISFFFSHMPFAVLGHMNDDPSQSVFSMFFVEEA
ncbi:MAG TPA: hypothetical protein DCW52_01075, partial [Gammaproteobacteria bacterium]|nr:hypothetical protein [Gammaproteobacteria bacterium]